MLFKTHEKNIVQIKACVAAFGEVYVHGSGDIFPVYRYDPTNPTEQDHSRNHAENFNKGYEENSYRVLINSSNMPKNKAELDRLLRNAKDQEEVLKRGTKHEASKVKTIQIVDTDFVDADAEINYEALARTNHSTQEEAPKRGRKPAVKE